MKSKSFHIGESAVGGTVIVNIDRDPNKSLTIKFCNYKTTSVVEEQTFNGRRFIPESFRVIPNNSYWDVMDFLEESTSYYYAEKVVKWIKLNI